MTKQRILRISLISLMIFALLLSGQLLYKDQWLNKTVSEETRGISGVVAALITTVDGKSELKVEIDQIEDLQKVSNQLREVAVAYPIRYVDHRSEELEHVYKAMQFHIYEGLSRGNFVDMEEALKKLAKESAVDLDLSMDSEAIYVMLTKDSKQLVTVLERKEQGIFLASKGI